MLELDLDHFMDQDWVQYFYLIFIVLVKNLNCCSAIEICMVFSTVNTMKMLEYCV